MEMAIPLVVSNGEIAVADIYVVNEIKKWFNKLENLVTADYGAGKHRGLSTDKERLSSERVNHFASFYRSYTADCSGISSLPTFHDF